MFFNLHEKQEYNAYDLFLIYVLLQLSDVVAKELKKLSKVFQEGNY